MFLDSRPQTLFFFKNDRYYDLPEYWTFFFLGHSIYSRLSMRIWMWHAVTHWNLEPGIPWIKSRVLQSQQVQTLMTTTASFAFIPAASLYTCFPPCKAPWPIKPNSTRGTIENMQFPSYLIHFSLFLILVPSLGFKYALAINGCLWNTTWRKRLIISR
jgi:hypothetical protein